ncbi:MAG: M4 family metallopeptidase [Candidatus Obscuribacter sp.]|jgi:Zn-dependent metalloprotease|nr:M4 family metallopeptidase [Candidatus Obscuribacter sp.]MBL0186794.1 M4 family metallopeptidase [Candidatus Obscuribacter sp.]
MTKRIFDGVVPSFLLHDIAQRHPELTTLLQTIITTQKIANAANKLALKKKKKKLGSGKGDVLIYDAKNTQRRPGTKARFEGEPAVSDKIVNDAYEFQRMFREFLKQRFGLNSLDNAGHDLVGTVHFGKNYNNAFMSNLTMTYGDGDGVVFALFVLIDVIGHEMAHALCELTSGLDYYGESGALNESFSDVFGVCFRQWYFKLTADKDSWLVGPGIFTAKVKGVALRSMLNPGTAYNDPANLGKDPQPDHYSKLYRGSGDNGGVHINSGIPNKAFATWARAVGGNAWEIPLGVWYETNCGVGHVGPNCDFTTWAKKTIENANKMCPQHVASLKAAWTAVGVAF